MKLRRRATKNKSINKISLKPKQLGHARSTQEKEVTYRCVTISELTMWVSDLFKLFTVKNILKFKKLLSYK